MKAILCHFKDQLVVYTADHSAFFYPLAFFNVRCDHIQVGVNSMESVSVFDNNHIVKQRGVLGQYDLAVEHGLDFGILLSRLKRNGLVVDLDVVDRIGIGTELFDDLIF